MRSTSRSGRGAPCSVPSSSVGGNGKRRARRRLRHLGRDLKRTCRRPKRTQHFSMLYQFRHLSLGDFLGVNIAQREHPSVHLNHTHSKTANTREVVTLLLLLFFVWRSDFPFSRSRTSIAVMRLMRLLLLLLANCCRRALIKGYHRRAKLDIFFEAVGSGAHAIHDDARRGGARGARCPHTTATPSNRRRDRSIERWPGAG